MNPADAEKNWTPTPPTEPGEFYWRRDNNSNWHPVKIYQLPTNELSTCGIGNIKDMPGEWGGRVPAPGTTWTVEQFQEWVLGKRIRDGNGNEPELMTYPNRAFGYIAREIADEEDGIAATTARHRKEQG